MDGLPHLEIEGSPVELGRLHGEVARDRIEANIRTYFHRFKEEWSLGRDEVLHRARLYGEVIEEVDGDYMDALQGVVDGSGLPLLDVVALNVRYELVYSEYSRLGMNLGLPSGCTAVSFLPGVTQGGNLLMAQNWDWIPEIRGLVQQYRLPGKPEVLSFTEAGIVGGKIGLNSSGLGLLINGLLSDQDNWERFGVPFHVRCWQVLHTKSLEEAADVVRKTLGSCSANFLLGQTGDPRILDMETCPIGTEEILHERRFLTHTNHFHRGETLGIWEPLIEEKTTTFERQQRVDELVGKALTVGGKITTKEIIGFLKDHQGRPGSICRHRDNGLPEEQRYKTVVSAVMNLDERTMMVAAGNPCNSEYQTFRLGKRQ